MLDLLLFENKLCHNKIRKQKTTFWIGGAGGASFESQENIVFYLYLVLLLLAGLVIFR